MASTLSLSTSQLVAKHMGPTHYPGVAKEVSRGGEIRIVSKMLGMHIFPLIWFLMYLRVTTIQHSSPSQGIPPFTPTFRATLSGATIPNVPHLHPPSGLISPLASKVLSGPMELEGGTVHGECPREVTTRVAMVCCLVTGHWKINDRTVLNERHLALCFVHLPKCLTGG